MVELLLSDLKNIYKVPHEVTKTAIWTKINPSRKTLHLVTIVGGYSREKFRGPALEEEYVANGSAGSPDKKQGDGSYLSIPPKHSKFPQRRGEKDLLSGATG